MTTKHLYACNCRDNKDKPYKYEHVEADKDGICQLCNHYAVSVCSSIPLKHIADMLFHREIVRKQSRSK